MKLKAALQEAVKLSVICIAVDMWQDDVNKIHYLGMNVHFLERENNNKLVLKSNVMALRSFDAEERKTGNNVHRATMAIIHEYELQADIDSIVFVTDRGTNMISALNDYTRYSCINHICNNIISHAIEHIKDIVTKVSRIVKYMKVNGLNSKLSKALISYAATRWNTLVDMLQSFIDLYNEIRSKITNTDIANLFEEISYIEVVSICEYLKIYKSVGKETEGDLNVTCVKILPLIETIVAHNQPHIGDSKMLRQMRTTARNYIKSDVLPYLPKDYKLWSFFHPAWKKMDGFESVDRFEIVEQLKTSLNNTSIQFEQQEQAVALIEQPSRSVFAKFQDECTTSYIQNDAAVEIEEYVQCIVPNAMQVNILDWWEANKSRFPRLYDRFIKIAPIMASSASAERMFSSAGDILTKKRNRLTTEHIEQLLFLSKNLESSVLS